jgi:hypothetical protein
MSNSSSTTGGGIGFTGLLTIVFIVLKLLGHITWSWVWVLSPLWIPLAIILAIILIVGIVIGITHLVTKVLR